MADALLRQWTILQSIPRHPRRIKIAGILALLQLQLSNMPTYRTIQRDLDRLAGIFPQLKNETLNGTHYWYLDGKNTVLEIPQMEQSTALVFYMAQQQLNNQFPTSALENLNGYFNSASDLLDKHNTAISRWRDKIKVLPQTQLLIAPNINHDVLNVVYECLLNNQKFEAKYFGRNDDQYKTFLVNPLGLVFRGTVTYLVATLNTYQDIRIMSLHRFVDATPTEQVCVLPNGFSLDDYIKEGRFDFLMGDSIDLEVLVSSDVAIHLNESKLAENQQITPLENGCSLLTATVRDTGQLRWWLLGFADQIEVLSPKSLREEFKVKAQNMARKYAD